jgi:hypothetical protein
MRKGYRLVVTPRASRAAADSYGQPGDNGGMRSLAALTVAIGALLIVGCSMVLPQSRPAAVAGESTLAAIGLGDFVGGPDANKVGMIWVTAGPVAMDMPMPVPAGEVGKGGAMPAGRMLCVQWPDGSGMSGPIPDDWVPPATASVDGSAEATGGLPIGVLVLVGGAVVLIGASVLAFRREGA